MSKRIKINCLYKAKNCRVYHQAKKSLFGFTLAEVLIVLAVIGIVAAITIPGIVINANQMEYKTGLRKAVSVLNQAISVNKALSGETPYDNADLFNYLRQNMSVMKTTSNLSDIYKSATCNPDGTCTSNSNAAFYTTDGMRFEFGAYSTTTFMGNRLYESNRTTCAATNTVGESVTTSCGGCGSYGLQNNAEQTTLPPCSILVDINGDRKPTPGDAGCKDNDCAYDLNLYEPANPNGLLLKDIFTIIITDQGAIPYGIMAQKAMYQARK